ncbi:zinc finger protein 704 isoform X2 [Sinocyclocheilus grahami]|uniref:zinc finger protein 704 isoform X2 n=1 Tax=Sinocyclocheilus grahami TaxID=75366 RepID=UPI0007AC82C5|nr:PREDICTED: zinc finger protein 704 isoform X2 [Sinocyclocheilus grahami]
MHTRRLVKRSVIGSRVYAPGLTGDAAPLAGVIQAVKQDNRDASTGHRRNVYTVLMQDGSLKEYSEEEIAQMTAKAPLKSSLKSSCNGGQRDGPMQGQNGGMQRGEVPSLSPESTEEPWLLEHKRTGRALESEKDHTRSVSLLEQKRKVVSSSIDVPQARKSEEEVDMDKVTAAMVLTSLSTSPLVRSPPVKVSEGLNGSWKDGGFTPSSYSSSGYWSWSAPSDQSNPSTPSPPLSADSFKPFRMRSLSGPPDDNIDEHDGNSLLFDEPIPRKRKNSMKVMFKCLWKNCGKVLSTAAGIQRHIRTVHLGRNCDSECSDGEEDFYYTEIKLNTDSVADGLSSLSPVSPSVLSPPPGLDQRQPDGTNGAKSENSTTTPLSRSAPSALYLVHTDHAYQATAPVTIPSTSSTGFTPSSSSFSISWQSPPVTFTGTSASPTHSRTQGFGEQRSQTIAVLSSPPRAAGSFRKSRGEGKKCRKVYGMENRDMWCTACRWKKACQRFVD